MNHFTPELNKVSLRQLAASIFVNILVEMTNTVFVNPIDTSLLFTDAKGSSEKTSKIMF